MTSTQLASFSDDVSWPEHDTPCLPTPSSITSITNSASSYLRYDMIQYDHGISIDTRGAPAASRCHYGQRPLAVAERRKP